jgi:signal transduction histidine kinase
VTVIPPDDTDPATPGFVLHETGDPATEIALLERQLAQYVALTNAAGEAMWRCDYRPHFHYSYLNPAGARALDVTLEELAADAELVLRRTHPDDRDQLLDGRRDPRRQLWPMVVRWADRHGHYSRLEVREIPIVGEDGTVTATLGIARNLSELDRESQALRAALSREQRAVDELKAVDDLRQTFLRAVSHELRTPLAGVLGYAETLQQHRDRLPPERVDQLIGRLVRNATRLRDLLDDLLDIDRLARGTLVADRRPTDVALPVLRAVELAGGPLGRIRLDVQHVVADVDAPKIERIVDNLVHNALRHAGATATIWVHLLEEDGDVLLVVEDDGPGIDPALRERLFAPFEQGPEAASDAKPGTGLGLSLVRQFVQLHGGSVRVTEGTNGGARFEVRIPTSERGHG